MKPGFAALLGPSSSYFRRKKEAFYQNFAASYLRYQIHLPEKKVLLT
jgi:hypothetical protein